VSRRAGIVCGKNAFRLFPLWRSWRLGGVLHPGGQGSIHIRPEIFAKGSRAKKQRLAAPPAAAAVQAIRFFDNAGFVGCTSLDATDTSRQSLQRDPTETHSHYL
jgi:hypothetical protein